MHCVRSSFAAAARVAALLAATQLACVSRPAPLDPPDPPPDHIDRGSQPSPDGATDAATGDPPPVVDIALERARSGHIMVDVELDGVDYPMVLDTGASITVITPATRDALGLSPDEGTPVKARGANGAIGEVRVVGLHDLTLGARTYAEIMAAVMPLQHLERDLGGALAGIVGRNFLVRHRLDIDFPAARVRLHPREVDAPSFESVAIDFDEFEAGGLTRLAVRLDAGPSIPAVLDLGAARTVINAHAAATLDAATEAVEGDGQPLLGADGVPMATRRVSIASLRLGEIELGPAELHVADIEVFETLGIADGPAMIFGVDQIDDRRVMLDYPAKTLHVSRR